MVEDDEPGARLPASLNTQFERIANLLALTLVADKPQTEKIVTLSAAGFGPSDIAGLVGTTPNAVSATLYRERKKGPKKKSKKADD